MKLPLIGNAPFEANCLEHAIAKAKAAIRDGQVDYLRDPDFDIEKGSCLACVAVPKGTGPLSLDA